MQVSEVIGCVQVLPLGEGKTQVLMDYYVHPSKAGPFPECSITVQCKLLMAIGNFFSNRCRLRIMQSTS